jgi:hypothetical protein
MQHIRSYIREKQSEFATLEFFDQLDRNDSPGQALSFIRNLTFFVMVFQDILRLNEARVQDPTLRKIARHHRAEDRGHDAWFLHDLNVLEGSIPDVRELFATNVTTRDTAYQLMSEVFRTDSDRARVVLPLVLESTGHVFFTRAIMNAERVGVSQNLLYFARRHLDIELGHEMFEAEMNATIDAIALSAEERREIMALVDRSFVAITRMIAALSEAAEPVASVPSSRLTLPPMSAVVSRDPADRVARRRAGNGMRG